MELMYFVVIMDLYGGFDVYIEVSWLILVFCCCWKFGQKEKKLGLLALMFSLVALIEKLICRWNLWCIDCSCMVRFW